MQHNDIRQYMANCPDLAVLDDAARAFLLWRGEEVNLEPGKVLYSEGSSLDDTFCLLIFGELLVEIGGVTIGHVPENQLLGEMAYFIQQKARTATIRAGSLGALVLKIQLTGSELAAPRFTALKQYLGTRAWDRFVSNSQRAV
jgi:hypothetical protein